MVSERCLSFFEAEDKWLYFILTWIAGSLARVPVRFEFKRSECRDEAIALIRKLKGRHVWEVIELLSNYR